MLLRTAGGIAKSILWRKSANQTFQISQLNFQERGLRLFQIFDKEKLREERKKLLEESSRGYWDDFKELRLSKGKLFKASEALILKKAAKQLPDIQVLKSEGTQAQLRAEFTGCPQSLLCIGFRKGADQMLASWRVPYESAAFPKNKQIVELSIVESVVMSWWPFKNMILRGQKSAEIAEQLQPKHLFYFQNSQPLLQPLGLTNRLTGYVLLVDKEARIRWRGCGEASPEELQSLMQCSRELQLQI